MRILTALSFICIFFARAFAFAPNRSVHNNARSPATSIAAGLFDNIFKTKEQGNTVERSIGSTGGVVNNVSVKKQLDGLMKKKKFSVLIIASSAKDSNNKAKQLLEEKRVKYKAIELDKEANAEAIRAEFGSGIWIRGRFIPSFNELSTLDKKGDLDDLLKNAPKTTYTTPR